MSKELEESIKRFETYCLFNSEQFKKDFDLIKSALEHKKELEIENTELKARNEKLEKVWEIIVKEIEDSFISGIYPNEERIAFGFKILKKDKPEQFNLLKEMLE